MMVMMTAMTPSEKASRRVVGKCLSGIVFGVFLGVRIHLAAERPGTDLPDFQNER
jgi:hypothetical protein